MERHILIITTWYPSHERDTEGMFIRDQAYALAERGNRVGVMFTNIRSLRTLRPGMLRGGFFRVWEPSGDDVVVYRLDGWNWPPRTGLVYSIWFRRVLPLFERYCRQEGRPDLIHAHVILGAGVFARMLGERAGIPYVVTEHVSYYAEGLIGKRFRPLVKDVLGRASARIVVSSDLGRVLARFTGVDPGFVTIPNIIDTDYFTPGPVSPEYRPDPDRVTFLCIASHTPVKRIDLLLCAFAARFRDRGAVLLLVGGGPLKRRLERLAVQCGIDKQVRFLGILPRAQVRDVIRSSDCVVLSSFYETFGLALAEAMACGKPVIATDSGGPAFFVNETNGILVKGGDIDALGDALFLMADRHQKYSSDTIRSGCVNRFGKDAVCGQLEDIYQDILAHDP